MKTRTRESDLEAWLSSILLDDPWHREALEVLRETAPFAWITGGFVRNAIWDSVFHNGGFSPPADVDVIYLEIRRRTSVSEKGLRVALSRRAPDILWSVKDQGRMHLRSADSPYRSLDEALRAFPDRSSAIAVRLLPEGHLETMAPFGLEDAFRGIVRPTPTGLADDRYESFLTRKLNGWRQRWPRLMVAAVASRQSSGHKAA